MVCYIITRKRGIDEMAIGGKRKTKRQTRFKQQRVATMTRRIIGERSKRRTQFATGSRFRQFLKNYDNAIERGELRPIKEIEELREKWQPFMNKDGTPSRVKLKSKKRREEWNADMKAFNKKYRRWGKKAVQDIGEKQREKRQKQAVTFSENQKENLYKELEEKGEDTSAIDFEKIAKEESDRYLKMLDLFAMDSLTKLREELNIGSPVIQALAGMGLKDEVIDSYLKDFRKAYMNIPSEARDLAKQDDLDKAVIALARVHGEKNLTDVLATYIKADTPEERMQIALAGEFHADAVKDGRTTISFNEFWEESRGTTQTKWGDFL